MGNSDLLARIAKYAGATETKTLTSDSGGAGGSELLTRIQRAAEAETRKTSDPINTDVINRMLGGSNIMGNSKAITSLYKPAVIEKELEKVQDELAGTYGTANPFNAGAVAQKQEGLKAKEKALKAELEAAEPTNAQKVGLALKSIGNANVGSLWSLGETAVQGAKNTVEEFQDEEYRTTLSDLTAAKEKLRFAERSKNMSAKAMSDYEAALAEVNRLQAKLDSLQVKTSVGAGSLGQQTLAKANEQKEAALQGTEGVGRWVGENLISVAQNASMLPLAAVNPTLPAVAMGTIAAGSKAAELNAQGVAPGEALIRGGVSGGIEALTEKIPLDNILGMVKVGGKSAIKNLLKQAGVEATEEAASYVLNYIADKAAGDPNATFDLKELANAAASGAFSGGIMGGGATLVGNALNPAENKNTALPEVGSTAEYRAEKPHNVEYPNVPLINLSLLDVEGIENGEIPESGKGLRKGAINRAKERLGLSENSSAYIPASNVVRNGEEYVLKITTSSLNKMLNPADGSAPPTESIVVLDNIEKIAKNGIWVDSEGDRRKRAQIPGFDYLRTSVYIDGVPYEVNMRVKIVQQTQKSDTENVLYYLTPDEAVTIKRIDTSNPAVGRHAPNVSPAKVPTSNGSVTDTEPVVNTQPFVPPAHKTEPVMPPIFKDGKVVNPDDSVGAAPAGFTGNVERGYSKNLASDQARHKDVQHEYQVNPQMYFRLANKDTLNKAIAIMETGLESAKEALSKALGRAQEGYKLAPEMVPLSKMVGDALAAEGRIDEMERILSDVAAELTEAGQLGQAAVILRDTSPSAKIQALEKAIAKINGEGRARYKNKWKELSLTDAEKAEAASIAQGDEAAFEALYEKVAKRLGTEIPSTLWEKITEIRRISMLRNPKTQVRNVVGNIPLTGMRKVSESLSGAIQDSMVKRGKMSAEDQTRTRKVSERSKEIAGQLFEANKESLKGSADKWDVNGMLKEYRKYFGDNAVGRKADAVREFTYKMLEAGDMPFLKSAFVDNAAGYIEAQGYTTVEEVPQKVIDFAAQQAMEATFKDFSIVASTLNKLKKNGGVGGAALDILFPFTTTPINITKRTVEYSPAGLLSLIGNKKTAAQNIDTIAKSLTGTGVILLGVLLAKWGLATAGADENEDKAALDKATGKSPYSFGGRVSYEWMQPIGTQLAMGAEVWEAIENGENPWDAFIDAIIAGGDTILDMTVFSNVKDLFSGYGSPSETILETLTSGVASQLTPSLFGAVARSIDPIVRSVSYNEGVIPAAVTGVIAKTPGASKTLPATVNVKGEENRRIENPLLRTAQEMLNPANVNTGTRNKVDDEIYRLYGETGKLSVFPKKAENKVEYDNQTYRLTSEQKQEYQRDLGGTYYDMVSGMMESDIYKNATPEQQAEYLGIAEEYAAAVAKKGVVGDDFEMAKKFVLSERADKELGISQEEYLMLYKQYGATLMNGDDIREAYASGMDVMSYLDYGSNKPKFNTDGKQGYTTSETSAAINGSGLSKDEQTMLWLIEKPEWGEKSAKFDIDPSVYVEYKAATIGIEGDKKPNGETISGSKKKKLLKVLREMGVSASVRNKILEAEGYSTK